MIELTRDNGGEVLMYEYYVGRSAWRNAGFYLMHLIPTELAFFKKLGAACCAVQADYKGFRGKERNLFVFAKNSWDLSAKTDDIPKDCCQHRYDKAAEPIFKHITIGGETVASAPQMAGKDPRSEEKTGAEPSPLPEVSQRSQDACRHRAREASDRRRAKCVRRVAEVQQMTRRRHGP